MVFVCLTAEKKQSVPQLILLSRWMIPIQSVNNLKLLYLESMVENVRVQQSLQYENDRKMDENCIDFLYGLGCNYFSIYIKS